ncbi:MAG TPA: GntR family transcriptional regulator [Bacillus bacterium]|uniref:GntR family transcriptional regulator n=1 Tax=Siminovitchia fordii TaxID=254759 RepID=UPI0003792382|nr:GntR family transcriptional regulator [Siminovitchia fordii]HBZ09941.1 GntR family transcriptional regulator [Bacillus sp. (in: firmicutes)]
MKKNSYPPLPLYLHIKEALKEKIDSGIWKPGDQIPNELHLAAQFGVSRSTVREAVLQMVREDLLVRYQGKGTFVSHPKIEGDLVNFYFPSELGTKHLMIGFIERNCTISIAKILELPVGELIYEIKRIRYFHSEPAALETSYIQKVLVPNLEDYPIEGRLYDLLKEEYQISITNAENYIEPILLNSLEAGLLETKMNKPGLKLTRIGKTVSDRPVILTYSLIRGDKARMFVKSK